MKILFSTFGSLGDIHPYLAVALEAKHRGHTPIIASSEKYREKIEFSGIEFRAVRPDLPPEEEFRNLATKVMNGRRGPEFLFKELITPHIRDTYADLLEAGADCDAIITHPAAPAGPLAASKLGKKWYSSALAPISVWSIYDPPTPPTIPAFDAFRVLGPLWGKFLQFSGDAITRRWVREIEDLRDEEHIALSGNPVFQGQYSPYGTLALFSERFCSPQPDWPVNTMTTGFCFFDASGYGALLEPETPDFQSDAIVFTLGSSAVWDAGDFWNLSANYSQRLGQNAIFLTGEPTGTDWPDHVEELTYAPHSKLFPRAKLVVHQGGIGTVAQCLRAGVPQVIMPYAHDQPDNARRIENLKVGRKISKENYAKGNGEWALELLDDAIENNTFPARRLGIQIRRENGPLNAVNAIEQLSD
jgi:rhamnosyltransferase subunit B